MDKNTDRISILEKILSGKEPSGFSRKWMRKGRYSKESMTAVYDLLKLIDIPDKEIASHAEILSMRPENVARNYESLSTLGLSDKKIASRIELLGMKPETIERNYGLLSNLGIKDSKIFSRIELLGRDPKGILANNMVLHSFGFDDAQISSSADLLGRNAKTLKKTYYHHTGILKKNYLDRISGRDTLKKNLSLLSVSNETLDANIQYLHRFNVDYNKEILLLGTKVQSKRKKMAWMLRELFDYRSLKDEYKPYAIKRLYLLINNNPRCLVRSIPSLEERKYGLRQKLDFDTETLKKRYYHHAGSFNKNYHDKDSGKNTLKINPSLLDISNENIDSNIQYLHTFKLDYGKETSLFTTDVQSKRKNMAWMLRNLFDYRCVREKYKPYIIKDLYRFISENPECLVKSIPSLENDILGIRKKIYQK